MKFGTTPAGGASAGSVERSVPGGIVKGIARSINLRVEYKEIVSNVGSKETDDDSMDYDNMM